MYGATGMGGGPPPGFFRPPSGPPPVAAPTDSSGATTTDQRGFLLVIKGTSPYSNASSLLESKFCEALKKIGANDPKSEYAIVKAVTVSANLIRDDTTRLQQMKQNYDTAANAKLHGAGSSAGFGGMNTNMGGPPQGFVMPGPPPGIGQGGSFHPPVMMGNPAALAAEAADEAAPYKDHLLGEDMRNDWEFTVLVAVVLDPKPAAQASAAQ
jgi:hypothetical protein